MHYVILDVIFMHFASKMNKNVNLLAFS